MVHRILGNRRTKGKCSEITFMLSTSIDSVFTIKSILQLKKKKILQARFQQYVNQELLYVQAGYRKGRGTRDQIDNIFWITEKAREFHKNIYFCFIDYAKVFACVDHNKLENSSNGNAMTPYLPPEKSVCRSRSNS